MLEFSKISLDDKQWVDQLLEASDFKNCEYCFGNIFLWANSFGCELVRYKGLVSIKRDFPDRVAFYYPAGTGDIKGMITEFIDYSNSIGKSLVITSLTRECAEEFVSLFGDSFEIITDRDYSDYIYKQEDLATLSGKKFHGKRNHMSYFEKNNQWSVEKINSNNVCECVQFLDTWLKQADVNEELLVEKECILSALNNFTELNFKGILIRTEEHGVVAFTMGEKLSSDTFCTHFEKARYDIRGAYPIVNREFAKVLGDYTYINREEDLGDEGLRKSKLSYHPDILLNKYSAILKV